MQILGLLYSGALIVVWRFCGAVLAPHPTLPTNRAGGYYPPLRSIGYKNALVGAAICRPQIPQSAALTAPNWRPSPLSLRDISPHCGESPFTNHNKKTLEFYYKEQKEKELCKDLLQTKEQVSDTNSSEITIIPA